MGLLEEINGYANGGRVRMGAKAYQSMMAERRFLYGQQHDTYGKEFNQRRNAYTSMMEERKTAESARRDEYKQIIAEKYKRNIPKQTRSTLVDDPGLSNILSQQGVMTARPAVENYSQRMTRINQAVYAQKNGITSPTIPTIISPKTLLSGQVGEDAEKRQARIHAAVVANRGYNRGGVVRGYANGGTVNGGGFDTSSFDRLSSSLDKFSKMNIPESITLEGNFDHTITVIGESSLASAIVSAIQSNIEQITQNQLKKIMNFDTGETKAISPGTPLGK